jgi:endoglucanase
VGINPNSPSNPHSALASGGTNVSEIDTVPAQEAYVLYGAVVGGPDKRDRFWDIRSDWPETEVALDYNAPLLTLTAMHLSNTSTANALDPPYTALAAGAYAAKRPRGLPCDAVFSQECGPPELPKSTKIAMGVVLTVVGLALIGGIGWWVYEIRKSGGAAAGTSLGMSQVTVPDATA